MTYGYHSCFIPCFVKSEWCPVMHHSLFKEMNMTTKKNNYEQVQLAPFFKGLIKFDEASLTERFDKITSNCDVEFAKFKSHNVLTGRESNLNYKSALKLCVPKTPKKVVAFNVVWAFYNGVAPKVDYPLNPIDDIYILLLKEQLTTCKELTASISPNAISALYQRIFNDFASNIAQKYKGMLDFTTFLESMKRNMIDTISKYYTKLDSGMIISTSFLEEYEKCRTYLLDNKERIHIYHGPAGTGKSYLVRQQAVDNSTVITSLSNTIAIANAKKIPGSVFLSKSKLSHLNSKQKEYSKYTNKYTVIFDEFSQWDCTDLSLVIKLMKMNPNAQVYFMGDLKQIHTFIANGCLLYEFVEVLKLPSVKLDVLRRFESANDALAMHNLLESMRDGVDDMTISCSSTYNIRKYDIAVCFTNDCVLKMNKEMLSAKYRYIEGSNITSTELLLRDLKRQNITGFKVFATITRKYGEDNKVYTNQQFKVLGYSQNYHKILYSDPEYFVRLENEDGIAFNVDDRSFNWGFAPAYAITADKAQGLEWCNVLVYLPNMYGNLPMNLDEKRLYVSLSRYQASCDVFFDGKSVKVKKSHIKYMPLVQYH